MELALIIWFISSLDSLSSLFVWLPVIAAVCATIVVFIVNDTSVFSENDPETAPAKKSAYKWWKRSLITLVVGIVLATALPSTKTAWMMAGGYVAQSVVTSDTSKKFAKLIEVKLDAMIEEAMPKVKEKE